MQNKSENTVITITTGTLSGIAFTLGWYIGYFKLLDYLGLSTLWQLLLSPLAILGYFGVAYYVFLKD